MHGNPHRFGSRRVQTLNDTGLKCFDKLKEGLEARHFSQAQVDPCVWYKEEMELLFYVDNFLTLISYKDKID